MLNSRCALIPMRWSLALVSSVCIATLALPAYAYAEAPVITEQTESFLGNRSSVGALVGGILAGASFATPLAPLGGTIIGFFIGKSTDYSQDEAAAGVQRRGFVPASSEAFEGTQLALSDPDGSSVSALALSKESGPSTESELLAGEETDAPNARAADVEKLPDNQAPDMRDDENEAGGAVATSAGPTGNDKPEKVGELETKKIEPEPVHLVVTKEVGRTQDVLDDYAKVIREEQDIEAFEPNPLCSGADAPKYRKKLAVAGFPLEHPEQSVFGGLNNVGKAVSSSLYQRLEQSQRVQAYSAPQWQMFASSSMAPTMIFGSSNRLGKYSAVSREMGAQFVMSGIIRDVSISDPEAWSTDYGSKMKRAVFGSDTRRNFELDMFVHDGYTGRVIMEKRYSGSGEWDVPRNKQVAFGSDRFFNTAYGQAVEKVLADMASDVLAQLDCQPMLVPITEVAGKDLLLDVGTPSGLLPGAKMRLVRAESSLARPDEPAQLWDTDVELHIHSLSLDSARAWMPKLGSQINIQRGDYAVIY
ncbi:flagella assembly protein FlgT middle domain-containing protein [Marinobacter sp. S6332]|uniref:flagella assembly protein FlgT middle domain-containing protein n=1 Tax=Marinobacter sp. S6332 TaxID=2926403 RepID=UPI001FF262A3|nr:flagella assembly protein FlgT middle domain-containing protein [Marinobacter sp. S6332]MCK0163143.1 hypothetical protein [Marinobacter sp. S6332]